MEMVDAGDARLSVWEGRFWIDWGEILLGAPTEGVLEVDGDVMPEWNAASHVLTFLREPEGEPIAAFELSIAGTSDGWVVTVTDRATGGSLGSISGSLPATPMESILEAVALNGLGTRGYFVTTGDRTERVPLEWVNAAAPETRTNFIRIDGTILAYVPTVSDTEIWRTSDAREWELVGSAPWGASQFIRMVERDGVVMVAEHQEGSDCIYRSEDGVNWARPSQPPLVTCSVDFGFFASISDAGWIWVDETGPRWSLWTSI